LKRDEFDVYQSRKAVSIRSEEIAFGHRDFVALLAPPVNGAAGHKRREHVRRSAILAPSKRHHARRVHFVYEPRCEGFMFERGNGAHRESPSALVRESTGRGLSQESAASVSHWCPRRSTSVCCTSSAGAKIAAAQHAVNLATFSVRIMRRPGLRRPRSRIDPSDDVVR
jgi:hypothetical protein